MARPRWQYAYTEALAAIGALALAGTAAGAAIAWATRRRHG